MRQAGARGFALNRKGEKKRAMARRDDDIERSFEGRDALQKLLTASGSLADVEDVYFAFQKAAQEGVPPPVVIQALWDDEPRFAKPADARRLFSNLLGLAQLAASGKRVDLGKKVERLARQKAVKPAPFGADGPDEAFVEAAWRYLEDAPKERQRLAHAFDNRQDALASWLDEAGLGDAAFGLARHLVGEAFALLELGGAKVGPVSPAQLPKGPDAAPQALKAWLEERVQEALDDDALPEPDAAEVRAIAGRAVAGLWAATA